MKKKLLIIFLICIAALSAYLGIEAWRCSSALAVESYAVNAPFPEPVRIVQLTDLHSWTFGEGNTDLITQVETLEPDIIVMTGDMLDKSDENANVACSLIRELVKLAPVYYGYGNHEYEWMRTHGENLTPTLEAAGATVLDTSYTDVTLKGQTVRIGGYHGYYHQPGMYQISQEQWQAEWDFFNAFEKTDRYKLLLCHIPTPWLDWGYINDCPVDLVLAGHYHGGQIRLPVIGGLYAPYVGLLPEYTEGIYTGEKATCILSAGLGASPGIPRIHNLPQIVVIDLKAE